MSVVRESNDAVDLQITYRLARVREETFARWNAALAERLTSAQPSIRAAAIVGADSGAGF